MVALNFFTLSTLEFSQHREKNNYIFILLSSIQLSGAVVQRRQNILQIAQQTAHTKSFWLEWRGSN